MSGAGFAQWLVTLHECSGNNAKTAFLGYLCSQKKLPPRSGNQTPLLIHKSQLVGLKHFKGKVSRDEGLFFFLSQQGTLTGMAPRLSLHWKLSVAGACVLECTVNAAGLKEGKLSPEAT